MKDFTRPNRKHYPIPLDIFGLEKFVEEKPVPFLRRRSFADLNSELKLINEEKDAASDFEIIEFKSKSETNIKM